MPTPLSAIRANIYSASALGNFSGDVTIHGFVTDVSGSKFNANITFTTGDVANPTKTFTPCDDNGEVKKFSTIDDVITWVNRAFLEVQDINVTFENIDLLSKPYRLPSDIVADSLRNKNKFVKLKADLQDNKAKSLATVAAMTAQGYNGANANSVQIAAYNSAVAKKDAILSIESWYDNRITFYTA